MIGEPLPQPLSYDVLTTTLKIILEEDVLLKRHIAVSENRYKIQNQDSFVVPAPPVVVRHCLGLCDIMILYVDIHGYNTMESLLVYVRKLSQ